MNDKKDSEDFFEDGEYNWEDEANLSGDSNIDSDLSYLYLLEPIDDIEENAFIIGNDVEPFSEERTRLTNFFIYNDVLFVIDSCYIGDSRTEEDEGDWETLVGFANPEGYPTMGILMKQYDNPISMIKGHLAILENPETMFEEI